MFASILSHLSVKLLSVMLLGQGLKHSLSISINGCENTSLFPFITKFGTFS